MNNPEKTVTRRRRAVTAGAAVLLAVFATAMTVAPAETLRNVDIVRTIGFVVLALVLAVRSTTAFSFVGRNAVLDDELTRANRASAALVGFWSMFVAALAVLVASFFETVAPMQIIPVIIGIGAVTAALRFVVLEGRGG
ncbi:hypothetical protein [Terricaulis silvestris]|uniref:Integral membrane protein n=1 Tax=Terricaulis silvestris TaxID=2686094 RepID=A0A6I6MG71_9CAUL|nr:hypothetical protein [Terricaulis silvestris]QGZ93239.1 hypothetical protein DSM104635_00045 [Terricaulis silvestris]